MEAEDVQKTNLRSIQSVLPRNFRENEFVLFGHIPPSSAGCQDGICHFGVGNFQALQGAHPVTPTNIQAATAGAALWCTVLARLCR